MHHFPREQLKPAPTQTQSDSVGQTCGLQPAARLFLWMSRTMAFGTSDQQDMHARVAPHLGGGAALAIAYQYALLRIIAHHAKRRLKFHMPGCPCLGYDEAVILNAIGAFERHDTLEAQYILSLILTEPAHPQLMDLCKKIALLYAQPDAPSAMLH